MCFLAKTRGVWFSAVLAALTLSMPGCNSGVGAWGGMIRGEGYQLNVYDGIGVLISEGDNSVELNGRNLKFNGTPLDLKDKLACWAVSSNGTTLFLKKLTSRQMKELQRYFSRGPTGGQSIGEALTIIGMSLSEVRANFQSRPVPGENSIQRESEQ